MFNSEDVNFIAILAIAVMLVITTFYIRYLAKKQEKEIKSLVEEQKAMHLVDNVFDDLCNSKIISNKIKLGKELITLDREKILEAGPNGPNKSIGIYRLNFYINNEVNFFAVQVTLTKRVDDVAELVYERTARITK